MQYDVICTKCDQDFRTSQENLEVSFDTHDLPHDVLSVYWTHCPWCAHDTKITILGKVQE